MKFLYFFLIFFAFTGIRGNAVIQIRDTIPAKDAGGFVSLNLKLLDFMATTIDAHTNRIQWDVTGSTAATIYQVERSEDGKDFSIIGTVSAVEGQNSYYFVDANVNTAANWYRMEARQDAKMSSSIVVLVRYGETNYGLSLRPSATNASATTLYIGSSRNAAINLSIVDVSGRMMLRKSFSASIGGNYIPLDLSGFTTGFYYFSITDDYGKKTVLPFQKL